MTSIPRLLLLAAVVLLAGALAAGCSDDDTRDRRDSRAERTTSSVPPARGTKSKARRRPVVLVSVDPAEGSLAQCIREAILRRSPPAEAAKACAPKPDSPVGAASPLDEVLDRGEREAPSLSCAGAAANPYAAGKGDGGSGGPANHPAYTGGDGYRPATKDEKQAMQRYAKEVHEKVLDAKATAEKFGKLAAQGKENTPEAQALLQKYTDLISQQNIPLSEDERALIEYMSKHPPNYVPKEKGGKTDPNAVDACSEVATFVAECNRAGWATSPCRLFLQRLDGCGDPTVTDPAPDDEGAGCGLPAVDPETVKRVVTIKCGSNKKPVPGVDPCAPVEVEGTAHSYTFGHQEGVPCGDPRALNEEEDCLGTVTVTVFGKKDVAAILSEGFEKLGGPAWIVNVPGLGKPPRPPGGGGPEPETGGNTR